MREPVSADDIRENLKEALSQLQLLQEQGRLVVAEDSLNPDWTNIAAAVAAAFDGLELAMDATYWMQTLPDDTGDYPPLSDTSAIDWREK
jgi:hypothetical protein